MAIDIKKENFAEIFEEKINAKDYDGLKALLESLHPADIAEILSDLDPEDALKVFKLISKLNDAGDVLSHLSVFSERVERDILEHLTDEKIASILAVMETDEAADILNLFSKDRSLKILSLVPSDVQSEIKTLLQYESDTAGGLMDFEYLAVGQEKTVVETIEIIRNEILPKSSRMYSFINIYVVDNLGRLVGFLPMRTLLIMPKNKKLKDIMDKNVIKVEPDVDQEEVAKLFIKYDLVSLPVVDKENRMLGRITVDDIIDVIQEEATEDIFRMGGTDDAEIWQKSIIKVAGIRLPWLLTTLMGGLCSALILRTFKMTIADVVALVFFVPVIAGMGGNIGIQSSTIVVRGLATGYIDLENLWWILFREIRIGAIMGITCGSIVGAVANFMGDSPVIGLIVGVSMFFAITVAAITGCLTPMAFKKFKIDFN